jgi:hypothetical protein
MEVTNHKTLLDQIESRRRPEEQAFWSTIPRRTVPSLDIVVVGGGIVGIPPSIVRGVVGVSLSVLRCTVTV